MVFNLKWLRWEKFSHIMSMAWVHTDFVLGDLHLHLEMLQIVSWNHHSWLKQKWNTHLFFLSSQNHFRKKENGKSKNKIDFTNQSNFWFPLHLFFVVVGYKSSMDNMLMVGGGYNIKIKYPKYPDKKTSSYCEVLSYQVS